MGGLRGRVEAGLRGRTCDCRICGEHREERNEFFNGLKQDFQKRICEELVEMDTPDMLIYDDDLSIAYREEREERLLDEAEPLLGEYVTLIRASKDEGTDR